MRLEELIDLVESGNPEGTPLHYLTDSVRVADHLNVMADHLIGHFVDQARRSGSSWAHIGAALGVTKQAAQKRFVPRPMQDGTKTLFARFNDEARAVVMESMEQARASGHDHIDTGHVVLGLVANPKGLAVRAFTDQGVSPDEVRVAIHAGLDPPTGGPIPDHIPWAGDAKKVLDLSLREAFRRQDPFIGAEHILLAVLRDQRSLGARALAGLGVSRKDFEKGLAG